MKYGYLFYLLLFLTPLHLTAQESGISFFKGTWEEAIQEAKKQNKYIFLDAYTSWCGPCKRMEKEVFTKAEAGAFYNVNFINYQLDMEKGVGKKVAKEFNVRFYPTLLYLSSEGKLVHRVVGFRQAPALVEDGKAALNGNSQLYKMRERYEGGEDDPEFLRSYALMAKEAEEPEWPKVAAAYFKKQKDEALLMEENWEAIKQLTEDIHSREFQYLLKHTREFTERYGENEVYDVMGKKAYYASARALHYGDDVIYSDALEILRSHAHPAIDRYTFLTTMDKATKDKDWNAFCPAAVEYGKEYGWNSAEDLNSLAWQMMTHCEERQMLQSALAMAERSIELKRSYFNLDTKAWILYKMGKTTEARAAAKEAIKEAEKSTTDTGSTQQLLRKMDGKEN